MGDLKGRQCRSERNSKWEESRLPSAKNGPIPAAGDDQASAVQKGEEVMISSIFRYAALRGIAVIVLSAVLAAAAMPANASVVARIDISTQTMRVTVNGRQAYTWRVSTGRGRYRTPTGSYHPWLLKRRHYSSKYNGSPMPYSIFFRGGYAIHGTYQIRSLGRRASHGCVRLHPTNAARLYSLVRRHGMRKTHIIIRH